MRIINIIEQWLIAQKRKQEMALFDRGVSHAQTKLKQAREQLDLAPAKLALEVEGHYDEFAMGVRHALKDYQATLAPAVYVNPVTTDLITGLKNFYLKDKKAEFEDDGGEVERS